MKSIDFNRTISHVHVHYIMKSIGFNRTIAHVHVHYIMKSIDFNKTKIFVQKYIYLTVYLAATNTTPAETVKCWYFFPEKGA